MAVRRRNVRRGAYGEGVSRAGSLNGCDDRFLDVFTLLQHFVVHMVEIFSVDRSGHVQSGWPGHQSRDVRVWRR